MSSQIFELGGELLAIAIEWHDKYKKDVTVRAHKLRAITGQEEPSLIERLDFYGESIVIGISKNIPGTLPMKDFPGHFKPDKRFKAGKELAVFLKELMTGIPLEPVLERIGLCKVDVMDGCAIKWAVGFNIGDRYFIAVPILMIQRPGKGQDLLSNSELTALTEIEFASIKESAKEAGNNESD